MSIFKDILNVLRQQEAGPLIPVKEGLNQYGLSVSSDVVSLSVPPEATHADIYVRTASVVFTRDRSAPTATRGLQADPTDIIVLNSRPQLLAFRALRQGGTDATVDAEYFSRLNS